MMNLKEVWTKKTLVGLGLGQFLSLLITSTGFSSSELARRGINAPTSQSFLNYVLLALVYGGIVIYRRKALKAKWYYYVLLALVDVEANFLADDVEGAFGNNFKTKVILLLFAMISAGHCLKFIRMRKNIMVADNLQIQKGPEYSSSSSSLSSL